MFRKLFNFISSPSIFVVLMTAELLIEITNGTTVKGAVFMSGLLITFYLAMILEQLEKQSDQNGA